MQRASSPRSATTSPRALLVLSLVAAGIILGTWLLRRPPAPVPNVPPPTTQPEVARTNLTFADGRLRVPSDNTPFTGFILEHFPNGTLRSRSAVSNGLLQGLSEGWYTNAQLQISEHFKDGVSHGLRTKWYASGKKQSEAAIVDGKLHGTFRKWHENEALSEQAEFVQDRPEGLSMSYYPSGYLKARVLMREGKAVEQTFWKDGEKKE